jgi:site-specific recombinase XerD
LGLTTSFHALRHTFATETTDNGVDLRTLAALLGHDDPKTTIIYSHVKRECLQQLLNLWKGNGTS